MITYKHSYWYRIKEGEIKCVLQTFKLLFNGKATYCCLLFLCLIWKVGACICMPQTHLKRKYIYVCLPGLEWNKTECCEWKGCALRAGGAKAQKSCSWKSHCWQTNLFPEPYSLHPTQLNKSGRSTIERGCWGWLKWRISSPNMSCGEVGNSTGGGGDFLVT